MIVDNTPSNNVILNKGNDFALRESIILDRIKKHYSIKLNREVDDTEAHEIADNLLGFSKAVYGIE